jgi:hypothetical protein
MRRFATIGILVLTIMVFGAACSVDVTSSDEYQTLETQLLAASAAQEDAEGVADQAREEADKARGETDKAREEADKANGRADKAEAALDEAVLVEWPAAARAEFVTGCVGESLDDTQNAEADFALCSCLVDELASTLSFVEFLLLSLDAVDSGAELNEFGLPVDMDPELVAALATAAFDCALSSSPGTTVSIFDLQPGDCFDDPGDEVEFLLLIACTEPHDDEVYATLQMPGSTWPGDDAVLDWSDEHCVEVFESYVGARWESSTLDFWMFLPIESSWVKYDDRMVACVLFDTHSEKLTGSMKGTSVQS